MSKGMRSDSPWGVSLGLIMPGGRIVLDRDDPLTDRQQVNRGVYPRFYAALPQIPAAQKRLDPHLRQQKLFPMKENAE